MKILYVCPKDTPPKGWGAVQKIIWERKLWLEQNGHQADLLLMRKWRQDFWFMAALLAKPNDYDLIHVECDWLIEKWNRVQRVMKFPMIVSTHYGYAPFPDKWNPKHYSKALRGLRSTKELLVQSPQIETALRANGVTANMHQLPNGIDCGRIQYRPAAKETRAICLGRIEPRKRQSDLLTMLTGKSVPLDFVGPVVKEHAFEIPNVPDTPLRHLGAWSADQVGEQMTDYSAYILMSDGETQVPLATMEAMAAGLSIVTTENAAHLLPHDLPFVYFIDPDKDDVAEVLQRAIGDNAQHREAIRHYALSHFDWSVIGQRYIEIAANIASNTPR